MPETPRLLFVHAHPDDESLSNGATIAHYTARGAQVWVVTCTLGEEGEVIGDQWARLAVDDADQLGGYRIGELTAALQALGVGGVQQPAHVGGWVLRTALDDLAQTVEVVRELARGVACLSRFAPKRAPPERQEQLRQQRPDTRKSWPSS